MTRTAWLALITGLLFAGGATAETLYVTDKLYLGLYSEPGNSGQSLGTMVSGTPLEVLAKSPGFAKVRTPDGKVGWTKTAYLVAEKPPRLQLDELKKSNDGLTAQLHTAQQQLSGVRSQLSQARQRAATASRQAKSDAARLEQLRGQSEHYRRIAARYTWSIPMSWAIAGVAAALIAGFVAGLAWLDRRIRRRHGGFRIY
ncbi:MAG: TIGR04211 family SH3 domain-containing protein [Gammaproteobacteria bacterium]